MNKKATVYLQHKHTKGSKNYHEEGIGTITILMAIATIAVIFYSIFTAFT